MTARKVARLFVVAEHAQTSRRAAFHITVAQLPSGEWLANEKVLALAGLPSTTPEIAARDQLKRNGYHVTKIEAASAGL
jgi:hypothetical protein